MFFFSHLQTKVGKLVFLFLFAGKLAVGVLFARKVGKLSMMLDLP